MNSNAFISRDSSAKDCALRTQRILLIAKHIAALNSELTLLVEEMRVELWPAGVELSTSSFCFEAGELLLLKLQNFSCELYLPRELTDCLARLWGIPFEYHSRSAYQRVVEGSSRAVICAFMAELLARLNISCDFRLTTLSKEQCKKAGSDNSLVSFFLCAAESRYPFSVSLDV